jgi:hypothetical protein
LNQEVKNHLNRSITSNEVEAVIESPNKEKPMTVEFTAEFYQTFTELTPILLKLFHKAQKEEMLPNSFYKASVTLIPKLHKDNTRTHTKGNYRPISLMSMNIKGELLGGVNRWKWGGKRRG